MAGLLLMAVLYAPLSGCLIPQDDELIPDLPPQRNNAIKIVVTTPLEPRITFYNSTSCLSLNPSFSLLAEDQDPADAVYSLWFIDKSPMSQPFQLFTPGGQQPRKTVNAPTSLSFKSAMANLPAGTHLLTTYVADTAFREVVDGQVTLESRDVTQRDGGVLKDEGSKDEFTWVLDVEPCP